jgi:hypothetical protein
MTKLRILTAVAYVVAGCGAAPSTTTATPAGAATTTASAPADKGIVPTGARGN